MSKRRRKPDAVFELKIGVDQFRLAGLDDGQAAIFPDGGTALVAFGLVSQRFPGFVFYFAKYVGGVGKRRHPSAIY